MLLKATDELVDRKRHLFADFLCSPLPVIFVSKTDRLCRFIYFQYSMGCYCYFMGVSSKVFHYLLWSAEGTFGINIPSLKANFMQQVFHCRLIPHFYLTLRYYLS